MTGFIPEGDTTPYQGGGHDGVHTIRRDGYFSPPLIRFFTTVLEHFLDLFESFFCPRLVVIIYI
jgi:hypothetical protein